MTAADVIRMLAEMDQQFISGRPSPMARAAEIVQELCRHAEGSLRSGLLGDFESIDLAPVRAKRASGELWQPVMDLAGEVARLREDLDHARTAIDILRMQPKTMVRRPGGCWDVFEDDRDAERFRREREAAGEHPEAMNVSYWNLHVCRE